MLFVCMPPHIFVARIVSVTFHLIPSSAPTKCWYFLFYFVSIVWHGWDHGLGKMRVQ